MRNLNNFDVAVQSWYAVCRSRRILAGQVRGFDILNRKIAIYRDSSGTAHALDGYCPHMGSDLSIGRVVGDCLQCPLHKWQISGEGKVVSAPYEAEVPPRKVRTYPLREKFGYLWIFNGPTPLFDLPAVDLGKFRQIPLPSRVLNNHPHFLTANGLDWRHLDTLHDIQFGRKSEWSKKGDYGIEVEHWGRPKNSFHQKLTFTAKRDFNASFETVGPNIAIISMRLPADFFLLFSNTPTNEHRSRLAAVLFLPRSGLLQSAKALWVYLFLTMVVLLYQDHRIFNTTKFVPGFTDVDEPFRMYAEIVNHLPRY